MMKEKLTDQKALPLLEGRHYLRCNTLCRCFRAAYNVRRSPEGRSRLLAWLSCVHRHCSPKAAPLCRPGGRPPQPLPEHARCARLACS